MLEPIEKQDDARNVIACPHKKKKPSTYLLNYRRDISAELSSMAVKHRRQARADRSKHPASFLYVRAEFCRYDVRDA
jgi:hypothetical protein